MTKAVRSQLLTGKGQSTSRAAAAPEACGLFRFGCRTCVHRHLAAEAHRQSLAAAKSPSAKDDQDFIDAVSDWGGKWRGEIWIVSGGKDYAGKPRPAVILQDDRFGMTHSVTVCACTTVAVDAPLFRLHIQPSESNGVRSPY